MLDKLTSFVTSALSESSLIGRGVASIGRVLTVALVAFVLGWDSSYVAFAMYFNNHLLQLHQPLPAGFSILPVLPDPLTLAGQAAFMTVFYFVNKTTGAYVDGKSAKNNDVNTSS